jgi:putative ABC transport system substrate-binding protein
LPLSCSGYAAAVMEMDVMQTKARALGLNVTRLEVRRAEDITLGIEALRDRADALYACADSLINANAVRIVTTALAVRLATMNYAREYVEAGGLMSYGPNYADLFRRAGDYVDKILHGAIPSDLPVEQPTKFDLTINARTAKALGITIPPALLARADEVFE